MSIYAQLDEDGDQNQIASNAGWSEFGDWAATLGADFPQMKKLFDEGLSDDIDALYDELESSLDVEPAPSDDVKDIVHGILESLDAADGGEILLVTNGVNED